MALFGPSLSQATLNHIRSTSTALSVPFMETGFEYLWERPAYSINVSPHPWSVGTVRYRILYINKQCGLNIEILCAYAVFYSLQLLGDC